MIAVSTYLFLSYTANVQKRLRRECSVYHAPWDVGDGGALDTKHGVQCLDILMTSSRYQHVTYDVIVFNFGLHDVDCLRNRPEEFTSLEQYSKNLRFLKNYFLATNAKVVYVLTTPVLDDCDVNQLVVKYNKAANDVMTEEPKVDVIDLYHVIVDLCGTVPRHSRKIDCPITTNKLMPHYTSYGYRILARPIIKTMQRLLGNNTMTETPSTLVSTK